jgi:hypothetical protein
MHDRQTWLCCVAAPQVIAEVRSGPVAMVLPFDAGRPCQRHVNERTSFFEGLSRWMQTNVTQFQE